ncbi:MAG: MBL fold metallo-hydrolase [Halanaeroarchaeum sp.]
MDVREDVTARDLPWSWAGTEEPITVTVVEGPAATVLFGTGDDSTADDLLAVAREFDVDVAVAEHGDVDHYGGIPHLVDALDPTIAIPAGDAFALEEAGVPFDVAMEVGETYWGVETIPVPGHTPDNAAYRYGDVLIAGDAVCGSDSPFAMAGDWPGTLAPLADQFNHDTARTLESVARLGDLDVETVLTAHGQHALEDGAREIAALIDAIEERS